MNIIVIGLGSMGRRRIRLLQTFKSKHNIVGIDFQQERRYEASREFDIEVFKTIEEAMEKYIYNSAFVCTSPLSHNLIIRKCLEEKMNVFTEINLVADGYDENVKLAQKNHVTLFLSSTFLYRDEIVKIKELVEENKGIVNYSYHVGQYLPDWHPWEDYNQFFVGEIRTNGCREIFAIELPWLLSVFGNITGLQIIRNKISQLQIGYYDSHMILLQHESGSQGMLAVDVVSRKAVRRLEVFGEDLYLTWSGSPDSLKYYDYKKKEDIKINICESAQQVEGYNVTIVEEAYLKEIDAFFSVLEGKATSRYDFLKDQSTLAIIDKIEEGTR